MQYADSHKVALHDVNWICCTRTENLTNLLEYASPLLDEDGAVRGSVGVIVDITARKAIEQRLIMQYQIAGVLAKSNSVNEAAGQVLGMICETVGWEYGALWRVEPDASTLKNVGVWTAGGAQFSEFAEASITLCWLGMKPACQVMFFEPVRSYGFQI